MRVDCLRVAYFIQTAGSARIGMLIAILHDIAYAT